MLLKRGPVIVTFYRGGWCPYCNLELKAFQKILPDITAAGAALVAISPEKPDDTLSTAEKNALSFEVLSDVGQKVGRAFGLVYTFSDELKRAYQEFGRDIPATNGADDWALPISAITSLAEMARSSTLTRMPIIAIEPTRKRSLCS